MRRAAIPKEPIPYYTKYDKEQINENEYKITITYFMYNGNALSNIDIKQTKTMMCNADRIQKAEIVLHNRVVKTYNLLISELRRIGANETAATAIIKEKMR